MSLATKMPAGLKLRMVCQKGGVFVIIAFLSILLRILNPFYGFTFFLISDSFFLYINDEATLGYVIKWKKYLSTHII